MLVTGGPSSVKVVDNLVEKVDFRCIDTVDCSDLLEIGTVENVVSNIVRTVDIVNSDPTGTTPEARRIISKVTETAGSETVTGLTAAPGPGTQISPLKSNHVVPKLNLHFDREATGKSIVSVEMNSTLMITWIQYWADIRVGELYEYDKYIVELFSIKRDLSELTLRIKMKTRQEGN